MMAVRSQLVIASALAVALGVSIIARSAVPASSGRSLPAGQATSIPTQPDWDALIKRLSSDSFETREAAQRDLEKISWESRAMLVKLAAATDDAEVKARLMSRIDQIDEQLATDPPPISLHMERASATAVGAALGKELGISLIGSNSGNLYTFNADKQPFWDIYAALSRQQPLTLATEQERRMLLSVPALRSFHRQGAFIVFASGVSLSRRVNAQLDPLLNSPQASLSLTCTMAVDPRVKVVQGSLPRLTSVIDDAGNVLLNQRAESDMGSIGPGAFSWSMSMSLAIPENRGKKIASAKGEARVVVQVSLLRREIELVEKSVNVPFKLAGKTITVTRLQPQGNSLALSVSAVAAEGVSSNIIDYAVLDAAGTKVSGFSSTGNVNITTSVVAARGPFKLIASVPEKTKTIVVPFELKNIPLP